jgi:CRP-like cAMP-binding protein
MVIQEADLFKDLSQEITSAIGNISTEESYEKGDCVFKVDAPADYFYILMEGRVRLSVGKEEHLTYTLDHPGEAFGWSSLVDRSSYTGSIECLQPTKLIKLEKEKLIKIFEKDPASGLIFFRRLAGLIGQRLINSYDMLLSARRQEGPPSYG